MLNLFINFIGGNNDVYDGDIHSRRADFSDAVW